VINDPDPTFDDCSSPQWGVISMTGRNVGDLLNAREITWGWFNGGFRPSNRAPDGKAQCRFGHRRVVDPSGPLIPDYIPHHQPFQYYASTANPHHLPPTSVAMIGLSDQANHQYDLADFFAALAAGSLPAVSFLKANAYQDGHAGYSDPLDEQVFLVNTINALVRSPVWRSTAVIISYDDSDGWYDHVMGPIVMSSQTSRDFLSGVGACGDSARAAYQGRCGYGPRLPLLIVSPYARANFVDHVTSDQSSILRFIEDNFNLGRIGDHSFDEIAGPLTGMFDFAHRRAEAPLILDSLTGAGAPPRGGRS
jgi:phospholipase C